jgi:hypothetical protein
MENIKKRCLELISTCEDEDILTRLLGYIEGVRQQHNTDYADMLDLSEMQARNGDIYQYKDGQFV